MYYKNKRKGYLPASDKQFCYYWLKFFVIKQISKYVIKCNQYFASFIYIVFINILINIIYIIQLFYKCFRINAMLFSRFLINNWYFASYGAFAYRNISSISSWWFIKWSNASVFLGLESSATNIVYGWPEIWSQFGLCPFMFSCATSWKLIILYCFIIFLYLISPFLCIIFSLVPYGYITMELIDCILLSSLELFFLSRILFDFLLDHLL